MGIYLAPAGPRGANSEIAIPIANWFVKPYRALELHTRVCGRVISPVQTRARYARIFLGSTDPACLNGCSSGFHLCNRHTVAIAQRGSRLSHLLVLHLTPTTHLSPPRL